MKHFNRYNTGNQNFVTIGEQLSYIAHAKPEELAIVELTEDGGVANSITWEELDRAVNRQARCLMGWGVGEKSVVAVLLPNGIQHLLCALAVWRLGACYFPLCRKTTPQEVQILNGLMPISLFVSSLPIEGRPCVTGQKLEEESSDLSDTPLPVRVSMPSKLITSGGSTGAPKLIVHDIPIGNSDESLRDWFHMSGQRFGQRQLLCGPLYHGAPSSAAFSGLFVGNLLYVPDHFDAAQTVRLVERYQIQHMLMVPTMMLRIAKLPDLCRGQMASLEAVVHTGGVCSPWLKQTWIDFLGPEKIYEMYSMSEMIGMTVIRGDGWLKHRGSVGRPFNDTQLSIRDSRGRELPPGQVGEIFMRLSGEKLPTRYVGHPQIPVTEDGFRSVGDMGYLDRDGYLYYCDRRTDMIVTGGENVFAAEVQNVLLQYKGVEDAAVIGLPSEEWGRCIHAVVQSDKHLDFLKLDSFMRQHLLPYKVPKSYEQVAQLPREENGKLNVWKLIEERVR